MSAYHRRWYDRINDLTLAMTLSQFLPIEIQMVIAKNLNDAIDTHRSASRLNLKQPISVDPLQVLGLYKASRRQRWYDPNMRLSRAYNFMGTLPEPYLINFAGHIIMLARSFNNTEDRLIYRPDTKIAKPPVVSILQGQGVDFEESDDGFRVVNKALEPDLKYIRPAAFR